MNHKSKIYKTSRREQRKNIHNPKIKVKNTLDKTQIIVKETVQ